MPAKRYSLLGRLIFSLFIVGLVFTSNISSQALEREEKALEDCFRIIQNCFIQEDAGKLAEVLPVDYKIELRMGFLPPSSGFFSPSQVFYIWQMLFIENDTLDFELNKRDIYAVSSNVTILQARWSFSGKDSLKIRRLTLYFSLSKQANRWVIGKIRAK